MVRLCITAEGPTLDDFVEEEFGHAAYLIVVDPETWEFEAHENVLQETDMGYGIQTAENIAKLGPDVVLTGYMGVHGQKKLDSSGIKVIMDEEGTVRDSVKGYIRRHLSK